MVKYCFGTTKALLLKIIRNLVSQIVKQDFIKIILMFAFVYAKADIFKL